MVKWDNAAPNIPYSHKRAFALEEILEHPHYEPCDDKQNSADDGWFEEHPVVGLLFVGVSEKMCPLENPVSSQHGYDGELEMQGFFC